MSAALQLLRAAGAAGVTVSLDGDGLALKAQAAPPAEVVAGLRQHKAEVVALLKRAPADWSRGVSRLTTSPAPAEAPPDWWRQLGRNSEGFLAEWGNRAQELGWQTLEVFGVGQWKPYQRTDLMGLVPLLGGKRLVVLTDREAVLETAAGARQTYRRGRANTSGAAIVPAWDLARGPDST